MGIFDFLKRKKSSENINEMQQFMSSYMESRQLDIQKNAGKENDDIFEVAFGTCSEFPFFLAVPAGQAQIYLSTTFVTEDDETLSFERVGSYDSSRCAGLVDRYDAFTSDGHLYKSIYVNDYCTQTSIKTPMGFKTKYGCVTVPTNNLNINPQTGYIFNSLLDQFMVKWFSGQRKIALEFLKNEIIKNEKNTPMDLGKMYSPDWISKINEDQARAYYVLGLRSKGLKSEYLRCVANPFDRLIVFGRLLYSYYPLLIDDSFEDYPPEYNVKSGDLIFETLKNESFENWREYLEFEFSQVGYSAMKKKWGSLISTAKSADSFYDLEIARAEYLLMHLLRQHSTDTTILDEAKKLICEIAAVDCVFLSEITSSSEAMRFLYSASYRLYFYRLCVYLLNKILADSVFKLSLNEKFVQQLSVEIDYKTCKTVSLEVVKDLIAQVNSIPSYSYKNISSIKEVLIILERLLHV